MACGVSFFTLSEHPRTGLLFPACSPGSFEKIGGNPAGKGGGGGGGVINCM